MVVKANGWDWELTKTILMTALTGAALRHLRTLPNLLQLTLTGLLDAIQQEFGRPVPRIISQLLNRPQRVVPRSSEVYSHPCAAGLS